VEIEQTRFPPSTGMGIIDGMAVIAPAWFDKPDAGYLHREGIIDYPPAPLDQEIGFSMKGYGAFKSDGALFTGQGWGVPEGGGVWSDGSPSSLMFHAPDVLGDLRVKFDVMPYVPAAMPRLSVNIKIDGMQLAHWDFVSNHAQPETIVVIPASLLARKKNISLRFEFDKPRSPKESGVGTDARMVALFIRSMRLEDGK
jgi:hypothetical protein